VVARLEDGQSALRSVDSLFEPLPPLTSIPASRAFMELELILELPRSRRHLNTSVA
jgi:hypothetical protein